MGKHLEDPKLCTLCKERKPRTDFYKHSKAPRGVSSWCKHCTNVRATSFQKDNREKALKSLRRARLKKAYGLTMEGYEEMLAAQNYACAICDTTVPGGKGNFVVDHCHATQKIRALLCNQCNVGLGALRDSPELLRRAAAYIEAM